MRRKNHHHRPTVRALLPLLLTVLVTGGCGDPGADARDSAVGQARQVAADAKASFAVQLRQAAETGEGDGALRDRLRSSLDSQPAGLGRSLEVTLEPGRQVVAQMVFFGHGEAGGGWTKDSYNVRLCAVLRGPPGPAPAVQMEALTCPADLQGDTASVGTIDETVPLSD